MTKTAKEKPAPKAKASVFAEKANKQFGEGTIFNLEEGFKVQVTPVPTGVPSLDFASGIGGLPLGRIVEIFGDPSSGKTTLCLSLIAEAQKLTNTPGHPLYGKIVSFLDVEHAIDYGHAECLGVDINKVHWSQPMSGEQVFDLIDLAASTGEVGVMVIDSVAAMASNKELDEGMDYNPMGLQARLMSQGLRKVNGPIAKAGMLVIFINQTRAKMTMYGDPTTTSGGNALPFYASVRMRVSKKEKKEKDVQVGQEMTVKFIKNKVSRPGLSTTFDYYFSGGVDKAKDIMMTAIDMGIIHNRGAYYFLGSDPTDTKSAFADGLGNKMVWQGKAALEETLKASPGLFGWINEMVQGLIPKDSQFVSENHEVDGEDTYELVEQDSEENTEEIQPII